MKKITFIFILTLLFSCKNDLPIISGKLISPEKDSTIREYFPKHFTSPLLKTYSLSLIQSEKNSDNEIPLNSNVDSINNIFNVSAWDSQDTISTLIEMSGQRQGMFKDICVELTDSLLIVVWISRPFYKSKIGDPHPKTKYSLRLKCISRNDNKVICNKEIYSTKFGIDRLSMTYNPFAKSILFSYNDFSKPNSDYLMYGFININELKSSMLEPKQILSDDESEKRYPKFLKDSNAVYLYHTSGDTWGLLSGYTGKKSVGISKIDKNNKLLDYQIITDEFPIDENLLLMNDTIYYRLENVRNFNEMQIKNISINKLFK